MKKLLLLVTLGLGLWTLDASAATYYVSKTGSDAHGCSTTDSAGTNKLTIRNLIANCLNAGDTGLVHVGNYVENLDSGPGGIHFRSGTNWTSGVITLKPYPSEAVTIQSINLNDNNDDHSFISYWIFDGFEIKQTGNPASTAFTGDPVRIANDSNHIRVQNCNVWNSNGIGLFNVSASLGPAGNIEILNNQIHDAYVALLQGREPETTGTYGIYFKSNNSLIEGNTIYNCTGYGIHMYHPAGEAPTSNNIVRNNVIHDNATNDGNRNQSLAAIIITGGTNNSIYNNIFYANCQTAPGGSPVIQVGLGQTGGLIYNNTIYGNVGTTTYGIDVQGSSGTLVKNNIIYGNNGQIHDTGSGTVFATNLCGSSGTGCSVIGNPVFADAANHDFHILTGSPAKDAGTTIAAVLADKDGFTRPQGAAYDIGAYEFIVNIPPPVSTIAVTSPNGGENLVVGTAFPIKWTSNDTHTVKIEASRDGGASYSEIIVTGLAQTADSANSYSWTPTAPQSYTAKIRITNESDSVADDSNAVCNIRGKYVK